MTKQVKRSILALLLLCAMALSACAGQTGTTAAVNSDVSYVIKVVDKSGNPVVGASVTICQDAENGTCFLPKTTDEKGEAVFYRTGFGMVEVQDNLKVRVTSYNGTDYTEDQTPYPPIENGKTTLTLQLDI